MHESDIRQTFGQGSAELQVFLDYPNLEPRITQEAYQRNGYFATAKQSYAYFLGELGIGVEKRFRFEQGVRMPKQRDYISFLKDGLGVGDCGRFPSLN